MVDLLKSHAIQLNKAADKLCLIDGNHRNNGYVGYKLYNELPQNTPALIPQHIVYFEYPLVTLRPMSFRIMFALAQKLNYAHSDVGYSTITFLLKQVYELR